MNDDPNDEPCMCGTQAECEADLHLMGVDQAATLLNISKGSVLVAVHRGKLETDGRQPDGSHVFARKQLKKYADRYSRHAVHELLRSVTDCQ